MMKYLCLLLALVFHLFHASPARALTGEDIARLHFAARQGNLPTGEKIALFAEAFEGAPYDPDPLGAYVSKNLIVFDESVDCMYHVFRSAELALSKSPEEAVELALTMRFPGKGKLGPDGKVLNYEERFQYGLDMLLSGKWGRDVTAEISPERTRLIEGSRGVPFVRMLPAEEIPRVLSGSSGGNLKSGDIVFFIKAPEKRVVGEVVGHMGVLKVEAEGAVYLIHASGSKGKGGAVRKLRLADYAGGMPFAGIMVSRFD